ncbi:MAG: hypothetical protein LBD12_05310, partial [Clostridiales Family XIII bacterium]|jgi:UDP-N-acetylmuramoyl-L-alanyl-D-glutamate--2,6-diaminopimelate ligase|nr:hypothetical protein [Clostridiales Family XIII bacterium]
VGVFTNLSPEHLDDHGTMEDYRRSKLLLFGLAEKSVINADDPAAAEAVAAAPGDVLLFGIAGKGGASALQADACCVLLADKIEYSGGCVTFTARLSYGGARNAGGGEHACEQSEAACPDRTRESVSSTVSLDTPSEFAIYNALAAIGAVRFAGVRFEDAAAALNERVGIPGRYEVISSEDGRTAIVDYAHTAGALENLLHAVRSNPAYREVISVFGCGGDRDPSKRAPMGEISCRLADFSILTSDNPRTEDMDDILDEVERGAIASGAVSGVRYEREKDRAAAIEKALRRARPGDVVVIAGKGHEEYQILGKEKVHFDDREQVRAVFAQS